MKKLICALTLVASSLSYAEAGVITSDDLRVAELSTLGKDIEATVEAASFKTMMSSSIKLRFQLWGGNGTDVLVQKIGSERISFRTLGFNRVAPSDASILMVEYQWKPKGEPYTVVPGVKPQHGSSGPETDVELILSDLENDGQALDRFRVSAKATQTFRQSTAFVGWVTEYRDVRVEKLTP